MKTKLLLSLFVTLISVSILFSKYNEIVNTALDNNEIPQEIIKTHQNKFFGAVTDQWSKQKAKFIDHENNEYYVVSFRKDGRGGHKAFYDGNHNFVAYVGYVASYNLPENIQLTATNQLQNSYVKFGELIEIGNSKMFLYRVRINNDGLLKYVYFDKEGKLLERKNISPKVFSFI